MKLDRVHKIGLFCLAAVLVLSSGGVSYASFAHTLDVTGTAQACYTGPGVPGSGNGLFIWAVSNDNKQTEDHGGYHPIDAGDNGLDPAGSLIPSQPPPPQSPGLPCTRYDKNVARTAASIDSDNRYITVMLENTYPYYHPTVFFGLKNAQPTPGIIESVAVTNTTPNDLTVRVNDISPDQVIEAGTAATGSLDVQVEQAARQDWKYTFKVEIILSWDDAVGGEECSEGTPGFWRNNWAHFYRQSDMLGWLNIIDCGSRWISDPTGKSWTIDDMYRILDAGIGKKATDRTRFLRHYLATRLNIQSGRLNPQGQHNLTGISGYRQLGLSNPSSATLAQIVNAMEARYPLRGDSNPLFEIMKNICDGLNNLLI
jgi:hypothetical protein